MFDWGGDTGFFVDGTALSAAGQLQVTELVEHRNNGLRQQFRIVVGAVAVVLGAPDRLGDER